MNVTWPDTFGDSANIGQILSMAWTNAHGTLIAYKDDLGKGSKMPSGSECTTDTDGTEIFTKGVI